ncbi:putative membrane protein [Glaesserella parasuis 29755]|nr:putative membrane protein [Glaesserella parasuis str. Nagasaki]EQA95745.1 putative membrane protein [Glaesserella parasuis 29755]
MIETDNTTLSLPELWEFSPLFIGFLLLFIAIFGEVSVAQLKLT